MPVAGGGLPEIHEMNSRSQSDRLVAVRAMIWLYFWLLVWEGVLRKWIFPEYSSAIFIIRDPVVLIAYVLAIRAGVFPFGLAMVSIALIAILSLAFSIVNDAPLMVILFGLRTNYLHLPLIFIIQRAMDRGDVVRLGRWFMITSVPICLLMFAQF